MPRTERRQKDQRCLACGLATMDVVRFKEAAPYCRPCGEDLAEWHGWTMLPNRRRRDLGAARAPRAPRAAAALPAGDLAPPDRRPARPGRGRRRRVLPCAACRRQFVPLSMFDDGRLYCDDCGPRITRKMGIALVPERRRRVEGPRSWLRYERPTSGFYRDRRQTPRAARSPARAEWPRGTRPGSSEAGRPG